MNADSSALCGSATVVGRSIEEIFHITPIQSYIPRSIGGTTAAELRRIPDFARLRSLIIHQPVRPVLGNVGAQELAKVPAIQTLRKLLLPHQEIEPAGADALCSVQFPELETLNLYASPIGTNATVQLFCGEQFPKLRRLELTFPNHDALRGAIDAKSSARLRDLILYEGIFDNAAGELLARIPSLRTLRHLEFHGRLHNDGMRHLAESTMWNELSSLILVQHGEERIASETAAMFRIGSVPQSIHHLGLGIPLDDVAFSELLLKCDWPNLRELEMSNGLSDTSLEGLCESPIMQRLERLVLHYHSFSIRSAKSLIALGELENLKDFLAYNSFTPAANKVLKRHFGGRFSHQF